MRYLKLQLRRRWRDIQSWNRVLELVQYRVESYGRVCGSDLLSVELYPSLLDVCECSAGGYEAEASRVVLLIPQGRARG